jgi:hypothetical protein
LFFTDGLFEVAIDNAGTQLRRAGLAALFGEVMAAVGEDASGDGESSGGDGALAQLFARVSDADTRATPDDDRTAVLLTVGY